jgi:hypothetical protein
MNSDMIMSTYECPDDDICPLSFLGAGVRSGPIDSNLLPVEQCRDHFRLYSELIMVIKCVQKRIQKVFSKFAALHCFNLKQSFYASLFT